MLHTIIVILILIAVLVTAYAAWSWYTQRDQVPGRHRNTI